MIKPDGIHALLFDLGGVVINIDFDLAFQHWSNYSKFSIDEIRHRFKMDTAYEQHECGEIDASEYFAHLRKTLAIKTNDKQIAKGWNAIFLGEIIQTLQAIKIAKTRLPCFALSNTNPSHQAQWSSVCPNVFSAFDNIFVSSELGLRKPDHAAFQAVADFTNIDLSAMLFFDDTLEHIDGAKRAGMQAVHVRSPADIQNALTEIGV